MAGTILSLVLSKASKLLGTIQSLAPLSSSKPNCSVEEDLKQLESLRQRIAVVLQDAKEREVEDQAVKLWLTEIEDVANDAEDVLDEYHYAVLQAQVEGRAAPKACRKRKVMDEEVEVCGSTSSSFVAKVSFPTGMADRIKEIMRKLDAISMDRERLHLKEEDGERRPRATYPPPTTHLVDESAVYGREDDREKLIDLLLNENKENKLSVIPIVGTMGIGKTTLAQLVYSHISVQDHFNIRVWVHVSKDFDVLRLTRAIIESVTKQSCNFEELSVLQGTLKEKLNKKKVLLVLDDVWNEEKCYWESFQLPFLGSGAISIIVTTRNLPVAKIMQTVDPYCLSHLSEDPCRLLFQHYAFHNRNPNEHPLLVEIGKQIVKSYCGLPLALKILGGLLQYESEHVIWDNLLQRGLSDLHDDDNAITAALKLSYDRMPPHLKPCFLYLSMYPNDIRFDKDDVVWLWIANGYIQPKDHARMEDLGKEYFEMLLKRSVLEGEGGYYMHHLIHDLARSLSQKRCLSIGVNEKLCNGLKEVRHLYVGLEDCRELADFLCHNDVALRTLLAPKDFRKMYSSMNQWPNRLRALYLTCCADKLPDSIDFFPKHLRYLHIFSTNLKRLPDSMCLLYSLQILRLETSEVKELPTNIGKLISLSYMDVSGKFDTLPESVNMLENLHTLDYSNLHIKELPIGIGDLKIIKLRIKCCSQLTSVAELHRLVTLKELTISDCHEVSGLPEKSMPPNLQVVSIVRCWKLTSMVGLQDLAALTCLKLERCPKLQLHPIECFQSVLKVEIVDCPRLMEWCEKHQFRYIKKILAQKSLTLSSVSDIPSDAEMGFPSDPEVENPIFLKWLHIKGAWGSTGTGAWLPSTLETLRFVSCNLMGPLSLHENLSILKSLTIENCQHLSLVVGLSKLHALEKLQIKNCPLLQLRQEEPLPPNIRTLDINYCLELTSLTGLQHLASLRKLHLKECPKLQLHPNECLRSCRSVLHNVEIEGCPWLMEWCKAQQFIYIKDYI